MAEGRRSTKFPDGCKCVSGIAEFYSFHDAVNVEAAQLSFSETKVTPQNGIGSEPYEFHFEPVNGTFLCLHSMYMSCKARIVRADGSDCDDTDRVSLVNNTLMSMWKSIETRINNFTINPSSSYNVPYKAIMTALLSYDKEGSALTPSNFVLDTPEHYDTLDDQNIGFRDRRQRTLDSAEFDMCGPICADFLKSNNFLAPNNRLSLKFTRASDDFIFLANTVTNYKLQITSLAIYARRIKLDPSILPSVVRPRLAQQYMTPFTEVKEYALAAGIHRWDAKLYSSSTLPAHIIVGQVDTRGAVGVKYRNPFRFQHFDIKRINLRMNGIRIPNEPLEPDFEEKLYMRSFLHMYLNSGKYRMESGNCISEKQFRSGATLFPFDLTPDQCLNYHKHRSTSGVLELEIEWENPLPTGVTVFVHASSDQIILLGEDNIQPQITII